MVLQFLNLFLVDLLLLAFPSIYFLFQKDKFVLKDFASFFGFRKPTFPEDLLVSLKVFFIMTFVSFVLSALFYFLNLNDLEKVVNTIKTFSNQDLLILVYLLLVRVFVEEFFFRAFLTSKIGVLGSSFAFSLMHFGYGSIAEIIGSFFLGMILGHYYSKLKNIFPIYLAHMFYNTFVLIIMFR
ncbi:MAG: CPBP family intramembrane glutamic endopeptidase [Candidatus Diapherotrites archaeon]